MGSGPIFGHFPIKKRSGNFEHTGKVLEFYIKYWKIQEILGNLYFFCDLNLTIFVFIIFFPVIFNLTI